MPTPYPIDIVIVSYDRIELTTKMITYLWDRTKNPFRIIVVDNGSGARIAQRLWMMHRQGLIHHLLLLGENYGIHMGHNYGLDLVRSEPYYISTDNDLLCPELKPGWLEQLTRLMDEYGHLGAIACRPQILVGRGNYGFDEVEDVLEMGHIGAHLRIMRTAEVRESGGWRRQFDRNRNDEERWICRKLHNMGYKVGYAKNIYCYHMWVDDNWGYPKDITMEDHGHREIYPSPSHYARIPVDPETFVPEGR